MADASVPFHRASLHVTCPVCAVPLPPIGPPTHAIRISALGGVSASPLVLCPCCMSAIRIRNSNAYPQAISFPSDVPTVASHLTPGELRPTAVHFAIDCDVPEIPPGSSHEQEP